VSRPGDYTVILRPKPGSLFGSISSLRCHKSRKPHQRCCKRSQLRTIQELPRSALTANTLSSVEGDLLSKVSSVEDVCDCCLDRVAIPILQQCSFWWRQTGSNRRPHACKARALPAELCPRSRRRMLNAKEQRFADAMLAHVMSTSAAALKAKRANMVGLGRLELPTSRLSSARSNQLSYKP
jgi:hypothetical protein